MSKSISCPYLPQIIDMTISPSKLFQKIKSSDFLLSDEKCIHHIVGLRYNNKTMSEPEVTLICMRHELATAKQIAYSLGKQIFKNEKLSANIFSGYQVGQRIKPGDYLESAKVYAQFRFGYKTSEAPVAIIIPFYNKAVPSLYNIIEYDKMN